MLIETRWQTKLSWHSLRLLHIWWAKVNVTKTNTTKNKIWKFYYDRDFHKMSATTAALRVSLEFRVVHSSEGLSTISPLGSSSFAFTSIEYKCFTLLLIKRGLYHCSLLWLLQLWWSHVSLVTTLPPSLASKTFGSMNRSSRLRYRQQQFLVLGELLT